MEFSIKFLFLSLLVNQIDSESTSNVIATFGEASKFIPNPYVKIVGTLLTLFSKCYEIIMENKNKLEPKNIINENLLFKPDKSDITLQNSINYHVLSNWRKTITSWNNLHDVYYETCLLKKNCSKEVRENIIKKLINPLSKTRTTLSEFILTYINIREETSIGDLQTEKNLFDIVLDKYENMVI